jgi:hypothetical protein
MCDSINILVIDDDRFYKTVQKYLQWRTQTGKAYEKIKDKKWIPLTSGPSDS